MSFQKLTMQTVIPAEQKLADIFTKTSRRVEIGDELNGKERKINPDIARENQDLTELQEILTSIKS